jgi:hypothetical protein
VVELATRARSVVARVLCASLLLGACVPESGLDVLGVDETVIETRQQPDSVPDPPAFDPELSIVEDFDGCRMRVNKSGALTHLNVREPDAEASARIKGVIFATRSEALTALRGRLVIPSMEVVQGALKPFNDGLYAAIERIAEDGSSSSLVNKRATFDALLAAMLERAAGGDSAASIAAAHFRAAQLLAPGDMPGAGVTADIESQAASARDEFARDLFTAMPIGFYTWTPDLSAIFRRDRFLQSALPFGPAGLPPAAAVARALASDSELATRYERVLALYRGLTNPFRDLDPSLLRSSLDASGALSASAQDAFVRAHPELTAMPPCQARFSWLPASDSPETKLIASQYCSDMPPQSLLDALIGAIQSGAIDLTPTDASGFYDWQLYALETLLVPERSSESRHLILTQKYREKLVETFKSLLIQTRETHVKQLGAVAVPASLHVEPRPVDIYPLLPAEPFPTFYLRTARAYAFLRTLLASSLGVTALETTARLNEDGSTAGVPLSEELEQKTRLLYGLHLVAAASIGMRDELTADERMQLDPAATEAEARAWIAGWHNDADVARDPRVAVPMVNDATTQTTRNLAVVGVRVIQISARFPKGREPMVTSEGTGLQPCVVRSFVPFEPYMLVEQSLEFDRSSKLPPLTRDALRATLKGKRSLDEIRGALEAAK